MATHTKDMKWEYHAETNIAGGPAGAAYSYTAAASADELDPVNLPYNEEQIMPFIEYTQEPVEHAGQDISTKTTIITGIKYIDGKITQYMQNITWLDWALGISPAETGGGAVPKTFLLQWTNGLATYTSYGCYIKKYTLSGTPNSALKEVLEFGHVKTEEEGATFDTAWYIPSSTAVATFEDIASSDPDTGLTVGGNNVTQLNSFEIRVENIYTEEPHAGAYYHKFPYLLKRNVEIDLEFEVDLYDEVWDAVFAETTIANLLHTILINPLVGSDQFQATNMKVKNESTNLSTIPEKGIRKWKGTFEIGGASAFTTP